MGRIISGAKSFTKVFGGINGPKNRMALFIVIPAIIYYLSLRYYPVVQTMILSFSDAKLLKKDYQFIGLENYRFIFTDPPFVKAIINTTVYAFATTIITVVMALVLAFLLNPLPHGNNFMRLLFYLPMVTSGIAIATIWGWLYQARFGLFNQVLGQFSEDLPIPWLISKEMGASKLDHHGNLGRGGLQRDCIYRRYSRYPDRIQRGCQNRWSDRLAVSLLYHAAFNEPGSGVHRGDQHHRQLSGFPAGLSDDPGGPLDATRVISLSIYDYAFSRLKIGVSASMAFVLFLIVGLLTIIQLRMQREDWEL